MYDIEEIKTQVKIDDLVGQTVALKPSGTSLLGMCPYHDNHNTPALAVWPATGTWKCFGACNEGGDIFAWVMKRDKVEFKEAVRTLAGAAGVAPRLGSAAQQKPPAAPPPTPVPAGPDEPWRNRAEEFVTYAQQVLRSPAGDRAREYLFRERGLWPETLEAFRVGYMPKAHYEDAGRWGLEGKKIWLPRGIVIPGMWRGGIVWYAKVRRPVPEKEPGGLVDYIGGLSAAECITGDPKLEPKFGGPRGGTATLFGHPLVMSSKSHPVLILTEGEWDAMLGWQLGMDLADVGTLGGAARHMDARGLAFLAKYASVGVVMDADATGDKAREYWQQLRQVNPRVVVLDPPDHDLSDYCRHAGERSLRQWLARAASDLMRSAMDGIEAPEHWQRCQAWAQNEAEMTLAVSE